MVLFLENPVSSGAPTVSSPFLFCTHSCVGPSLVSLPLPYPTPFFLQRGAEEQRSRKSELQLQSEAVVAVWLGRGISFLKVIWKLRAACPLGSLFLHSTPASRLVLQRCNNYFSLQP